MKQALCSKLLFKDGHVIANTTFPMKSFKGADKACRCCMSGGNELLYHSTDISSGEGVESDSILKNAWAGKQMPRSAFSLSLWSTAWAGS